MNLKAAFFDRDGVINKRIPGAYVTQPSEFKLNPEIPEILKLFKANSYLLILITNQQGVGKGLMTQKQLDEVHNYMQNQLVEKCGFGFDDIFVCTDLASSNSYRRKPNPGMILDAVSKWNIDPELSVMIGDSDSDILAGQAAGIRSILIKENNTAVKPDIHIRSLSELKLTVENFISGK